MTDWQPIKTAPKDGTPILLFAPSYSDAPEVRIGAWMPYETEAGATVYDWGDAFEVDGPWDYSQISFTHWAPFEAPKP